jgi:hypothetical protein
LEFLFHSEERNVTDEVEGASSLFHIWLVVQTLAKGQSHQGFSEHEREKRDG